MPIIIPELPIKIVKPREILSEHDKFENNGLWFFQKAQWIVLNYFNTYSNPTSYTQPVGSGGTVTSQGNNFTTTTSNSLVDEMLDNYNYYYGNQDNRIFNFMTRGVNNNVLPNVFIKGQEVRSLVDHIIGKGLEQIEPIEDNISCDTISQNTLLKKQEVFDNIDLASKIGAALGELGVQYSPAGNIDYSNPNAIKEAKKKIKGEFENTATIIARNAYYTNQLKQKYLASIADTAIGNLTGIEFYERNGKIESNYIPCFQGIYDFSTWGEFGEDQTLAGYIVPNTLEDVLHEYPDMNPEWIQEIEDVLYKGVDNSASFMDYYNAPFSNVLWWYNDQKWISKSVIYWLSECDSRYVEKSYSSGLKKVFKIDDFKNYHDPKVSDASNMPVGTPMKKGYEIEGSFKVWKVHKAVLLGNKYLVEYGYDTYQVRPYGNKSRPILPIQFFCQGKMAGYVKSIVSRLKPKQDELDAVRYRIREYAANDLGTNIFVNGAKLTENLSALNLVNDMRTVHVSVIPATGDAEIDKRGMDDIIKVVSTQAAAAIKDYLVLKADLAKEMKDILNIPDAARGEQSGQIGKGVMAQTIGRSELSGLPFFASLNEFWRRCLSYAANKNKMIIMDGNNKDVVLPISQREAKILTITKDFTYEDLNVYLNPDDRIEVEELSLFRQMLQAYAQNPNVEHAEALVNALKMLRSKSFGEGISLFEDYIDKKKKDDEENQLREQTTEMQKTAYQNHSDQLDAAQQQIAQLTSDLAKINLKSSWDVKKAEVQKGLDSEAKLSDVYIEKITQLISEQMKTMQGGGQQQPQGQPMAQPQGQAAA